MDNKHIALSEIWLLNGIINGMHEPSWMLRELLDELERPNAMEELAADTDASEAAFIRADCTDACQRLELIKEQIECALIKLTELNTHLAGRA